MGMTGPALFRYVISRDELLTDLVIDAYNDFADALWASVERTAGLPPESRLRDQATTYRAWALEHAHRYLLLFGNPIPGYKAPVERTKPAAQRSFDALLALLQEVAPSHRTATDDPYERALETWIDGAGGLPLPGSLIKQAFFGWTRLHGVLALEIVGQFSDGLPDPALLYEAEVGELVRLLEEAMKDLEADI
jgi:AcrR family transcriptional regulator